MTMNLIPFSTIVGMAAVVACAPRSPLQCSELTEEQLDALPTDLSSTGLYSDVAAEKLADGVLWFEPEFELWSDGAVKRRWLWLPPGTRIDTSNLDDWRFPRGTKVWKEFARDGVRIETRLIQKIGDGDGREDWANMAYLWKPDRSDALAVVEGVIDAHGTSHNVPAAIECQGCHGGRKSWLLGVSAVQLARDAPPGMVGLEELGLGGWLSDPPSEPITVPGNDTERAALGYLHANCGNCHNSNRPQKDENRCLDPEASLDVWLQTGTLESPGATNTYRTMSPWVSAGNPEESDLIARMKSRRFGFRWQGMPIMGSEQVDYTAVALLEKWILELQ
jgi:hypothetical protein